MKLILSHENSDFDALASQLAAHKLTPDASPLLAHRLNNNVQQFLRLYASTLPFIHPDEWTRQKITEVILVDTAVLPNIRGLNPKTAVRLIDHHLDHTHPAHWHTQVEDVGATTTLLVEKLSQRGLSLTEPEANLLLLGIYEDTGSLSYDATSPRDLHAAAWVLAQGARLPVVRQFLHIPLSPSQENLLRQLQNNLDWHTIDGHTLALATATPPADFEDEISAVAHHLRDLLNPDALILLVQLSSHVQLVTRSTSPDIDVGQLARHFDGGGHSRASAAILHQPLPDALTAVTNALPLIIQPTTIVADLMSRRVKTLAPTATAGQAAAHMQRFGHEGYPVLDPQTNQIVGLITRRAVDRAVNHNLYHITIDQIMHVGHVTVTPQDSVHILQQKMMDEGWGQIPVLDPQTNDIIGIITRTDLLNHLSQPAANPQQRQYTHQLLTEGLSPAVWSLIKVIGDIATDLNMPIFFVGGLVRDLLLGQHPTDLDIVVEGDAIQLAQKIIHTYGGDIHTHQRFGTATWRLDDTIWDACLQTAPPDPQHPANTTYRPTTIDFVTARTEFYRRPSALPDVVHSSIKQDLHRRDFTINTLAIRLDGPHLGQLLDFYGGRRDLEQGLIRVLHSLSFIDDPTRILRAARFEQRLDFTIEPRTAELIHQALPVMDRISGARIRHEIELTLREPNPAAVLDRLQQLDLLRHIHPDLTWEPHTAVAFQRLEQLQHASPWADYPVPDETLFTHFALWIYHQSAAIPIMERLRVTGQTQTDTLAVAELGRALAALPTDALPSQIAGALRPYPPRVHLTCHAAHDAPHYHQWLIAYYNDWQHHQPTTTGHTLRQLGLPPGPIYKHILNQLRDAYIDQLITTPTEEQTLLQTLLQDHT